MTREGQQTSSSPEEPRAIVLRNVSRWFGTDPGVRDVTLTIPVGQSLGVIGPNGSGKTTLLKLMAGQMTPTTGELFYRDEHGRRNPIPQGVIGYAGHELMLYEQLTCVENLSFFATLYGTEDATDRIKFLLETLNLWHRRDDPVSDLSSGMKKKLSLCRALLHEPSILVLDEPFRGLDRSSHENIERLLDDVSGGAGSVLLASHRFREMGRFCRRVLILDDTSPVWRGRVKSDENLRDVYRSHLRGTAMEGAGDA